MYPYGKRSDLCAYLQTHGLAYERLDYPAIFTMAQAEVLRFPHPEWESKTRFVRDDKKQQYFLIPVKGINWWT